MDFGPTHNAGKMNVRNDEEVLAASISFLVGKPVSCVYFAALVFIIVWFRCDAQLLINK